MGWCHDVITTKITYNREVIRIIDARCASCHHPRGPAFSLLTYAEARPWAKAIQEEVLERRMPPWGAIKGFGEFQNDQALTPEQVELIADWVEGGAPEGEEKDLPKDWKLELKPEPKATGELTVRGELRLTGRTRIAALRPRKVVPGASFRMVAQRPDGSLEPLLWLQPFKPGYSHLFRFRKPLIFPAGTVIRGVPQGSEVALFTEVQDPPGKPESVAEKAQSLTRKP